MQKQERSCLGILFNYPRQGPEVSGCTCSLTKTVGVFAKRDSVEILKAAERICQTIAHHGLSVLPDETLAKKGGMPNGTPLKSMHADLLVTVGGDGTVLRAAHEIGGRETPILAINMGRRGYLTEVQPNDFDNALTRWMKDDYTLERQWKVLVKEKDKVLAEGLNEIVLGPITPGKMLSLTVKYDQRRLIVARADGLIVATPTGSTAHAFSAGGPVLESSLEALALVLIAPLQPVRSLAVPANGRLQVQIGGTSPGANIVADGRLETSVDSGRSLEFSKSPHGTVFVRFGETFLQHSLKRLAYERGLA
ncbi:MAG TPA: NAD(+)/NADH kinase [Candidatus Binatus sp.]|nr:NAD(+)/NADH kinase [Candidatus Binatus sp.]